MLNSLCLLPVASGSRSCTYCSGASTDYKEYICVNIYIDHKKKQQGKQKLRPLSAFQEAFFFSSLVQTLSETPKKTLGVGEKESTSLISATR